MKLKKTGIGFSLFFVCLFFSACASTPPPNKGYALAKSALQYSEKASAHIFHPRALLKARSLYKKGISLYRKGEYEQAEGLFERALLLAEKIEISGRVKKTQQEME